MTTCSIAVDNQAALKAFDSDMRSPGHHPARETLLLANRTQKSRNKRKYRLTLRWTAGHLGIVGNEKADSEAKRAVSGVSSIAKLLPSYLRKPLLISPTAVKRKHNDDLNKEWKGEWRQSIRGKKTLKFDGTMPSATFLKVTSSEKLSRLTGCSKQDSATPTVAHPAQQLSPQIQNRRKDKDNCPACGEEEENIAHFLLRCPNYAFERWALENQVKKRRKR